MPIQKREKLTVWETGAYALSAFGESISTSLLAAFFMIYLTVYQGLNPIVVGALKESEGMVSGKLHKKREKVPGYMRISSRNLRKRNQALGLEGIWKNEEISPGASESSLICDLEIPRVFEEETEGAMEIEFNRGWLFWKEGGMPHTVDIPHDAMLEEKRDSNCVNGKQSGFFPGGKYCYEKEFTLGEEALGKSVELFFEGVYQNCQVSVNGVTVGGHRYGYTEFRMDISGQIRQGTNRVTVLVDNSLEPNCRWYSGSGIYRPVHLYIRERLHPEKLEVRTKSWSPAIIEILADEGAEIAVYDGGERILAGGPGEYGIPKARLWSAEAPYLYTCTATLGGETIRTCFGIRKLEWSAGTGLLINGQRTLLRGGCIHHDNGVLGACGFADAEARRIRILKEAGYNAVRSAHNPMSRTMLDACDRLGMYVMDEAFDGWYLPKNYHDYSRWFAEDWQGDLEAMVEKDRNHPCVILYSIGNEVSETADEKGVEACGELAGYVRRLDPYRPVTCGINVLLNVREEDRLRFFQRYGGAAGRERSFPGTA